MNKVFALSILAVACNRHSLSQIGGTCSTVAECTAGAFCVAHTCSANECHANSDCGSGATCVALACTRTPTRFSVTAVHGDHADATARGGFFVAQGLIVEGAGFAGDVSASLVDTAGHVVDLLVSSASASSFHAGFVDAKINALVPAAGAAMTLIVTSGGESLARDVSVLQGLPGIQGLSGSGVPSCNGQGFLIGRDGSANATLACDTDTAPGMESRLIIQGDHSAVTSGDYRGTLVVTRAGPGNLDAIYAKSDGTPAVEGEAGAAAAIFGHAGVGGAGVAGANTDPGSAALKASGGYADFGAVSGMRLPMHMVINEQDVTGFTINTQLSYVAYCSTGEALVGGSCAANYGQAALRASCPTVEGNDDCITGNQAWSDMISVDGTHRAGWRCVFRADTITNPHLYSYAYCMAAK